MTHMFRYLSVMVFIFSDQSRIDNYPDRSYTNVETSFHPRRKLKKPTIKKILESLSMLFPIAKKHLKIRLFFMKTSKVLSDLITKIKLLEISPFTEKETIK